MDDLSVTMVTIALAVFFFFVELGLAKIYRELRRVRELMERRDSSDQPKVGQLAK